MENKEINRLEMKSSNIVSSNIDKIEMLFPNVVQEGKIDFKALKQELSNDLLDEKKEKYQLTWVGKNDAKIIANKQITKTLRPAREKSINFNNAKNIYIEGDNLEVLKILQESYLNRIDCIYIDPPYNTGNDFVYNDDFKKNENDELSESGQIDEYNNKLITNNDSNGRFHSDWLSMMYPRLKLARNLLKDNGVIFISIDENEYSNLKKICDEIFGEKNYIGDIIRKTKSMTNDSGFGFNNQHEYLLIFAKNTNNFMLKGEEKNLDNYKNPDNDPNGKWCSGDPSAKSGGNSTYFEIENPYTHKVDLPPNGRYWAFSKETLNEYIKQGRIKFKKEYSEKERGFIFKRYKKDLKTNILPLDSLFAVSNNYMNQAATKELANLMGENIFSYPKPIEFIKKIISSVYNKDAIILDFFSGSATTAHAVMQLNAEDDGNRKYIMVQIPEKIENASYKNLCDLGIERIKKINNSDGFRVYKVDSSNMKDIYYEPSKLNQAQLNMFESNIKDDRTAEDLLTQVILDLGLTLDLRIEEKNILNNKVYFVAENSLVACFDNEINIDILNEICEIKPLKVVFRESSFRNDSDIINAYERIKKLSPETEISVI